MRDDTGIAPEQVFREYEAGIAYKAGLGTRGLYEQNRLNERFFLGDQWHGANCGEAADRPLVRHNVIKRIGDYKMAVVGGSPLTVHFTAEGVPNTLPGRQAVQAARDRLAAGEGAQYDGLLQRTVPTSEEINLVMTALGDYFRATAERVRFDQIREEALRAAYQTGTGLVYTWWDDRVQTGLYADSGRQTPIRGDVNCEVLDVENVYFGDPTVDDVQAQPYILVAQRRSVRDLRREARRYGAGPEEVLRIRPDSEAAYNAGDGGQREPADLQKTTVITRFWKDWDETGTTYTLKAVRVCRGVVIRPTWEPGIRLYPLVKFDWERRRGCAYGESEITYLIPNQIAINRMITASVWAVMMMGMPIMVVNQDIVGTAVSNDPGQIIPVSGGAEETNNAIHYVNPPSFSPQFDRNIASLIANTLTQSGANDVVLGDVTPDNTSAIIAVREQAMMPLQAVRNRYYAFCEEIARIWAEFWVMKYGRRQLKVEDENGTWYLPFDGRRYQELLISTRVEAGTSSLWSESQAIQTLDNLFDKQVIDVVQYLTRLPKGTIPDLSGLIRELRGREAEAQE